ncbi:hypothetical protein GGR57DRAFT_452293 [Xylariaceae sp. FL1272]|nr:hypothetical protein GGR57DRAFT_452293 [Xylariaceae sp. FL1272]
MLSPPRSQLGVLPWVCLINSLLYLHKVCADLISFENCVYASEDSYARRALNAMPRWDCQHPAPGKTQATCMAVKRVS